MNSLNRGVPSCFPSSFCPRHVALSTSVIGYLAYSEKGFRDCSCFRPGALGVTMLCSGTCAGRLHQYSRIRHKLM